MWVFNIGSLAEFKISMPVMGASDLQAALHLVEPSVLIWAQSLSLQWLNINIDSANTYIWFNQARFQRQIREKHDLLELD